MELLGGVGHREVDEAKVIKRCSSHCATDKLQLPMTKVVQSVGF